MSRLKKLKLSILDLATMYEGESATEALYNSLELVQLAEKLGYTRYWFAEHHNIDYQVSTSPEILIAHAAAITERIRLGAGGIMLPNHSPLKVAEDFSILEALHKGRIDLGIGRAPGTDHLTALALRRSREAIMIYDFPEQFAELLGYFTGEFPEDSPFKTIKAAPEPNLMPNMYMLGSSDGGVRIAAEHGLGFAFAAQINPHDAIQVLRKYRFDFRPSKFNEEPYSILSIFVVTAETEEEANYLAAPIQLHLVKRETGQFSNTLPTFEEANAHTYSTIERSTFLKERVRFVVGNPEKVKEQLTELAEEAYLDEIMVLTMIPDKRARHRSLELLAEAFDLNSES